MNADETFDLLVIGAGPGGYVAAIRGAELGMKTACIEKEAQPGGVCLRVGCIPSKALLESTEYLDFARRHFGEHGITASVVSAENALSPEISGGNALSRLGMDIAKLMERKDRIVNSLSENVRKLLEEKGVRLIHGAAALAPGNLVEIRAGSSQAAGVESISISSISSSSSGSKVAASSSPPPAGGAGGGGAAGGAPEAVPAGASLILKAKHIILATGSEPVQLPFLPWDGQNVINSTEALSLESVPERFGIVGGGYIGLELGSVWARLGSKVTVIEMLPGIASALDGQVGRMLDRVLRKQGFDIRVRTRVVRSEVSGGEVALTLETGGREERAVFDKVLVAVGRKPLTRGVGIEELGIRRDSTGFIIVDEKYRTSAAGIYAIGDLIAGPMLAHKASAEGIAAVEGIAGLSSEVDYDAIPSVVYTSPEVASVGKTEEELKKLGVAYRQATFPFTGNARARCLGETDGLVKILAHAGSGRLLGVHIIGPRASELIAECTLALRRHATASDLEHTIHAHPTLAEAIHESAELLAKQQG